MNSEFSDFRSFYINHVKPRCNYPPETEPYKTKLANGLAITVRREHPDDYAAVENRPAGHFSTLKNWRATASPATSICLSEN